MSNVETSQVSSSLKLTTGSAAELSSHKGKALPDLFHQDTLSESYGSEEVLKPSFWRKLLNLFGFRPQPIIAQTTPQVKPAIEPIGRVPMLNRPEEIKPKVSASLKVDDAVLPPEQEAKVSKLIDSAEEMVAALGNHPDDHPAVQEPATNLLRTVDSLLEDGMSIEQIMNHVFKMVIKRQEESGVVANELFKKFNEMARVKKEQFQDLEDKAKSDEKVADAIGYAQVGLGIATFVTALVCAAAFFFPPVAAALPVTLSTAQTISAFLGAGAALTKAGESYYKGRKDENSANALERETERTTFKDASKNETDRMMNALETTQEAQMRRIKIAQQQDRLIGLVQQR